MDAPAVTADPDIARARLYLLLARMLAAPPDQTTIEGIGNLGASDLNASGDLGSALDQLAQAARVTSPEAAAAEYHVLFIGVGRGALVPYASYYLTGFLNERPLARVRNAMTALGIARADHVPEPEDHIAALCEMMSGLLSGVFGAAQVDAAQAQRAFFEAHLSPWAARFFADLEAAAEARLYVPVGRLGRIFVALEQRRLSGAA